MLEPNESQEFIVQIFRLNLEALNPRALISPFFSRFQNLYTGKNLKNNIICGSKKQMCFKTWEIGSSKLSWERKLFFQSFQNYSLLGPLQIQFCICVSTYLLHRNYLYVTSFRRNLLLGRFAESCSKQFRHTPEMKLAKDYPTTTNEKKEAMPPKLIGFTSLKSGASWALDDSAGRFLEAVFSTAVMENRHQNPQKNPVAERKNSKNPFCERTA